MLLPKPLSAAEQDEVAGWLRPEEAPLYWAQHVADQRHGLTTARKVAAHAPGDRELIRAGLLHDIGKSGRPPSAWGRTFATLGDLAGLPLPARWRRYRDHGPIGGAALDELGAGDLVVAFASLHPHGPPEGIDPERWRILLEADDD